MVGLNIELVRSLNPMYRRDVVPGATEPYALTLPLTEVTKFLDLEDSVYNYRVDELLTKRVEVEVNDDVPTYYHKSSRYTRGKKGRVGRRGARAGKRSKARYSSRRGTKATSKRSARSGSKRAKARKAPARSSKRKSTRRRRR